MKRKTNNNVQIDALNICYQAKNVDMLCRLSKIEMGEIIDIDELVDGDGNGGFRMVRIEGKYYQYVFSIFYSDGDKNRELGYLKFGLNEDEAPNEIQYVWINLENRALYSQEEIHYLMWLESVLHLDFHNISSLDLALDTPYNIANVIKRNIKDKEVITKLNGKIIRDRNIDRPEISYFCSGTMDKQNKYKTITIKQKKAIGDKSRGLVLTTYDKLAEIKNKSNKDYILQAYDNPTTLYRTEIHLNSKDVKSFLAKYSVGNNPMFLYQEDVLLAMFYYFINAVIQFKSETKDVSWEHILGLP